MRYLTLALLLFACGIGLTFLEREPERYTPVVRVRSTDGMFVTLVYRGSLRNSVCNTAIRASTNVMEESCTSCVVESADCSSSLKGIDRALAHGEELPLYTVSTEAFRIALVGPPERVQRECMDVASRINQLGARAACSEPVTGGTIRP